MNAARGAFLSGLAGAALGFASTRERAEGQTVPTLHVLTVASDPGALPFYAKEKGFFESAGLHVDVGTMNNGAAILAAISGDAVEIGNANAGSVAAAVLRGIPITIIADGGLYSANRPTTLLCVRPDSPIRGPKDLAGKEIAVNGLRLVADAALEEWLARGGVNPKSVSFVEMGFSAMQPLLESRRLDAAFIGEPVFSTIRSKVRVIGAPNSVVAREFSYASYIAKTDWVTRNPEIASRFAAAIRTTAVWANANQLAAGRILARYMKIPEELAATMTRVRYATSLQVSHLQPSIDIMAKYGYLSKDVDANTLITRL